MDANTVFAISLPLLLIGSITAVTWLIVRRRHRRERDEGTYRPPLILRVSGLVISVIAAILFTVGITQIASALSSNIALTDDTVGPAVAGAILLLAGLFVWLKNSTRLSMGAERLSYSKYLVIRGTMKYRDIQSVRTSELTKVCTITLRDIRGRKLDMPLGAADWSPLIEWALANSRPDIVAVFLGSPSEEHIPTAGPGG